MKSALIVGEKLTTLRKSARIVVAIFSRLGKTETFLMIKFPSRGMLARGIYGLATLSLVYSSLELARYIRDFIVNTKQRFFSPYFYEFCFVAFGVTVFLADSIHAHIFHRSR